MNDDTSIFDLDAEAAVISAVMIQSSGIDDLPFLQPGHFFAEKHRRIYEAILHLHADNKPVDNVTVMTRLRFTERLEQAGGSAYLTEVMDYAPAIANVVTYGRTVWDCWRIRALRALLAEHTARARVPGADVQEVLDGLEESIRALAHNETESDFEPYTQAANRLIDNWKRPEPECPRLDTGYGPLNAKLRRGLKGGALYILAARTNEGKTSFALNLAWNVAKKHKKKHVVFVCLEMDHDELAARVLASDAKIDPAKADERRLSADDWSRIAAAANEIHGTHLSFRHESTLTAPKLRGKLRRLRSQVERQGEKLGLVVVDYLQLMAGSKAACARGREQEIAELSRDMKRLATELDVPILCLSQLNREADGDNVKPQLRHLRESGTIEQNADVIMFLSRMLAKQSNIDTVRGCKNAVTLLVAKHRNGPKGPVFLRFTPEHTRFDALEVYSRTEPGDED